MPATLTPSEKSHTIATAASKTNYFITLCTYDRQCLFGEIVDGEMQLNELGSIVETEWQTASQDRQDIDCTQWVIMPNHIHGIVTLAEPMPLPPSDESVSESINQQRTLSAWMDGFKAAVTQRITKRRQAPSCPIWQPANDHQLIPHHFAFNTFRQYIRSNTHSWLWDKLHPDSPSDWLHQEAAV